jgi:hypothetical protein
MLCKCVSYFKWWVGVTWCHQAALCRCVSWLCYGDVSALCQVGVSGVLGVLGGEKKWRAEVGLGMRLPAVLCRCASCIV